MGASCPQASSRHSIYEGLVTWFGFLTRVLTFVCSFNYSQSGSKSVLSMLQYQAARVSFQPL